MYFFSYFSLKPYVVTPHLHDLDKMVQMRGHNICFSAEITKIIPIYHQILPLVWSSETLSKSSLLIKGKIAPRGANFSFTN